MNIGACEYTHGHRNASGQGMTQQDTQDKVFESVAELFSVLSTPIRLKIISAVCNGEKNVSELLAEIDTTQPNMSQHLATLYRCGVLAKRRDGTQIYYRLQSERVATLCRAVCTQVAIELESETQVEPSERLVPAMHR
jgi:DNA-binding transcriptional ArsR family regulator